VEEEGRKEKGKVTEDMNKLVEREGPT